MPNYRGLNIPFVSFGAVTSDDLFCEKEQALFDLYEKWGAEKRYGRALDIGANIGVHSILMAKQGWEVHSYEPDREHYRRAKENCEPYRVVVHLAAVSDHFGRETFVRVCGNTTGSHLKGDKKPYGELIEFSVDAVDCRPLFAWADFAKIDCEGHEARLIKTLTIENRCEMLVEVGNEDNARIIFNHIQAIGMKMWAQQSEWSEVTKMRHMPYHHSHGALFIGRRAP